LFAVNVLRGVRGRITSCHRGLHRTHRLFPLGPCPGRLPAVHVAGTRHQPHQRFTRSWPFPSWYYRPLLTTARSDGTSRCGAAASSVQPTSG
jgi:hypothetical protein